MRLGKQLWASLFDNTRGGVKDPCSTSNVLLSFSSSSFLYQSVVVVVVLTLKGLAVGHLYICQRMHSSYSSLVPDILGL